MILLALVVPLHACSGPVADSLSIVSTPQSVTVTPGETIPVRVVFTNTLVPREPIILTAEIEWTDPYGESCVSYASTSILVIQPVEVADYTVVIPPLLGFVIGSARFGGQPITPTASLDLLGLLWFQLNATLMEGESITLEYTLKAL